jgi:hypothetical protein
MCFSAEASFTSGVVISAIGIATLRKARKPEQRLFAVIPLLFAFQQFAEGVLWTTLRSGGYEALQNVATHIFLVTALIIWPVMVPLSVWFMEESKKRKRILVGLMLAGGIVSLFYAFCLISYNVYPEIQSFHLVYVNDFPGTPLGIGLGFYAAATIAPLFVSSVRRMRLFGILIATSCLITGVFYAEYLTSVWCFFAALISISIYWVLIESRSKASLLATEVQG